MKKTLEFMVILVVDDVGELDEYAVTGGINYAIEYAIGQGGLTQEADETTSILDWHVIHRSTK